MQDDPKSQPAPTPATRRPPDDPDVLREEDVTEDDALDEREREPLPSDRPAEG